MDTNISLEVLDRKIDAMDQKIDQRFDDLLKVIDKKLEILAMNQNPYADLLD